MSIECGSREEYRMKAIVKTSTEPWAYEVKDMPKPTLTPGHVLVQVKATGLCYSDYSILSGSYHGRKPVPVPMTMGHEGSGIIAEVNPDAPKDLAPGQRVAFEVLNGCGVCPSCKNGNKNMCEEWDHCGITYDGTFAEYILLPQELVHPIPDTISFVNAAVMEPLSLVVRSLDHVDPQLGESAVVIGPGTVGQLHIQALKSSGCKNIIVIGLDQDKHRFELAKKLGATHIVNASNEDPVEAVKEITGGWGVEILIETASSPRVWDYMLDLMAPKGRVSCFGLYPESNFSPLKVIRTGITIYGDVAFLQRHFMRGLQWLESGFVSGEALVTKKYTLDQAAEAFEDFRAKETVKCMFEL